MNDKEVIFNLFSGHVLKKKNIKHSMIGWLTECLLMAQSQNQNLMHQTK